MWPTGFLENVLVLLATRVLPASPNFGQGKHGQKNVYTPLLCRHSESWVIKDSVALAQKKFPLKNFGYGAIYENFPFFTKLRVCMRFFCRSAPDSLLMPLTFPIDSLNRYTPRISGLPQKLTWYQQFGVQIFAKWGDAVFLHRKTLFLGFFGLNKGGVPIIKMEI